MLEGQTVFARQQEINDQLSVITNLIESTGQGLDLDQPLLDLPGTAWLTVRVALLTTTAVAVGGVALDALTAILNVAGIAKPITNEDILIAIRNVGKPQISRT